MKASAVAIGTFDGIHRGHQFLIERLLMLAGKKKLKSVVVALERPVRQVTGLLTTPEEKMKLLSEFPLDEVMVMPVTEELTAWSSEYFLKQFIVDTLQARHLVVGENFAFGHGRQGDVAWIEQHAPHYGIELTVMKPLCYHRKPISSSRIRSLIHQSRIEYANRLLGRFYQFEGMPQRGRQLGRKLGFPTINLRVPPDKLLPPGVHIALAERRDRLYPAMVNIGNRPTFFAGGEIVPEVNLLSFRGKWPDVKTTIYLLKHLRDEIKFRDLDALKNQIVRDDARARAFFGSDDLLLSDNMIK